MTDWFMLDLERYVAACQVEREAEITATLHAAGRLRPQDGNAVAAARERYDQATRAARRAVCSNPVCDHRQCYT